MVNKKAKTKSTFSTMISNFLFVSLIIIFSYSFIFDGTLYGLTHMLKVSNQKHTNKLVISSS